MLIVVEQVTQEVVVVPEQNALKAKKTTAKKEPASKFAQVVTLAVILKYCL